MNSLTIHSSSIPAGWKSCILLQTAEPSVGPGPAPGIWGHPQQPTQQVLLLFSHEVVPVSEILWIPAHQAFLSFTISQSLHKCMSIELVMPSNHLILCCSLLLLPSIFPSIWVFSNESALHIRWLALHFSLSQSPSNGYSGLTSCRMDWFDLCALQGTPKSLPQHNWRASVLWHSAFFMVQLSHHTHDYWGNQSFDYMDLYQQRDVSVF